MSPIIPPALHKRDIVAMTAPAGAIERGSFDRGVQWLKHRLTPEWGDGIFDRAGFCAEGNGRGK